MSEHGVRKAVVPAAGRGTRMRPISRLLPKELLPLGSRPVLGFVLAEAAAAGIREVAIVLREGKEAVRRAVDLLAEQRELAGLEVSYIAQDEPTGLADAIALCRGFADGEPFALLLPDNVLLSPEHRLSAMLDLFAESGQDVLGVIEVGSREAGRFGNSGRFEGGLLRPGVFAIERLLDKKAGPLELGPGEAIHRTCGRYVCRPELFAMIEAERPRARGEYSEVPAYQRIIAERGALGCQLQSPLFDVGNPRGYLAASAYLHHLLSGAQASAGEEG